MEEDAVRYEITLVRKPMFCPVCGGSMIGHGHKLRIINHPRDFSQSTGQVFFLCPTVVLPFLSLIIYLLYDNKYKLTIGMTIDIIRVDKIDWKNV